MWCVEYADYRGTYLSFFLERLSKVKQFDQNDSEQLKSMKKKEKKPLNESFHTHRTSVFSSTGKSTELQTLSSLCQALVRM